MPFSQKQILSLREKIHNKLIKSRLKSNLSNLSRNHLETIFKLYDKYFFKGEISERLNELRSELFLEIQSIKNTNIEVIKRWDDSYVYYFKVSKEFLTNIQIKNNVELGGINCSNKLCILQILIEHEICHLLMYIFEDRYNHIKSSAKTLHGTIFNCLIKTCFNHTDTRHGLILELSKRHHLTEGLVRTGMHINFILNDKVKTGIIVNTESEHAIIKMNKRYFKIPWYAMKSKESSVFPKISLSELTEVKIKNVKYNVGQYVKVYYYTNRTPPKKEWIPGYITSNIRIDFADVLTKYGKVEVPWGDIMSEEDPIDIVMHEPESRGTLYEFFVKESASPEVKKNLKKIVKWIRVGTVQEAHKWIQHIRKYVVIEGHNILDYPLPNPNKIISEVSTFSVCDLIEEVEIPRQGVSLPKDLPFEDIKIYQYIRGTIAITVEGEGLEELINPLQEIINVGEKGKKGWKIRILPKLKKCPDIKGPFIILPGKYINDIYSLLGM